jgi:hypothetical protein
LWPSEEAQLEAAAFLARYNGRTRNAYRHDLRNCYQWAIDQHLAVLATSHFGYAAIVGHVGEAVSTALAGPTNVHTWATKTMSPRARSREVSRLAKKRRRYRVPTRHQRPVVVDEVDEVDFDLRPVEPGRNHVRRVVAEGADDSVDREIVVVVHARFPSRSGSAGVWGTNEGCFSATVDAASLCVNRSAMSSHSLPMRSLTAPRNAEIQVSADAGSGNVCAMTVAPPDSDPGPTGVSSGSASSQSKLRKAKPTQLRTARLAGSRTPALIVQDEVAGYKLSRTIEILWLEDGNHDLGPSKAISGYSAADHLRTMSERVAARTRTPAGRR